ncbi:hypothetical protein JCM5353_004806 [Sporobolomyces roseus]
MILRHTTPSTLRPAFFPPRSLAHLNSVSRSTLSTTSSSKPTPLTFQDKLILATNKAIRDATKGLEPGGIEWQKKQSSIEGLKLALTKLDEANELLLTLQELSTFEPDLELRQLAELDLEPALESVQSLRRSLLTLLLPPSPTTSLSALLELKSGVGGSESSLFLGNLLRMYQRLAVRKGWKSVVIESDRVQAAGSGNGGEAYKEAILEVSGEGAFGVLKREAGVHRVQRVPATESQGRVHTSTVSVIVLPTETGNQASVVEDAELFDPKDVKVETMRSRGAGGQHVNRTESAIRLTHLPTGISVSMQDSRSQHENRTKAYKVLRARLMDRKLASEEAERRSVRRNQVKGADRSEKIRTYNYPQGRLTDHRIPITSSGLEDAMEGGETLDMIVRELEIRDEEDGVEGILEE